MAQKSNKEDESEIVFLIVIGFIMAACAGAWFYTTVFAYASFGDLAQLYIIDLFFDLLKTTVGSCGKRHNSYEQL